MDAIMKISVSRFAGNPLLTPRDLIPSRPDFEVTCVLNPGAFRFDGKIGLLLRVAERPIPEAGFLATPILAEDGTISIVRVRKNDPAFAKLKRAVLCGTGDFI